MLLIASACSGASPTSGPTATPLVNGQRALVLGGGGNPARGWELGILKGLQDAGVDVTHPDLLVGSSAGAFLGAQLLSGRTVDVLYERMFAPGSPPTATDPPPFDPEYAEATRMLWTNASADTAARRAEVGQRALTAPRTISEEMQLRITANALADIHEWPTTLLKVSVVDVTDGAVRFIGRDDGVPIERALAADTASPGRVAPMTIGDRRYMDGGVGGTNVDGAVGYGIVLALTPGAGPKTEQELATLRGQGSHVLAIAPDADSEAARGSDPNDSTRMRPAAEAGYRQAAAILAEVRDLWTGANASR
ncbi:MAG TPA: patatin-like phospholipase family protein [Chloroflexota bacterium]|nr:patatin-like phospholipase family protein [Chloroflexota bacterium]